MNPFPLETLLTKFPDAKLQPDGQYKDRCPAHDDQKASLTFGPANNGGAVIHCHTGNCKPSAIMAAVGLTLADLMPPKADTERGNPVNGPKPKIAATYDYTDADGLLLYQVVRYFPKDFRQRRPDGSGGWIWNLQGVAPVLFGLPAVLAAAADGRAVYLVEGEKDALALSALGLTATTNAGGAEKWVADFAQSLTGAHVVLLPDNDAPGKKHMEKAAASLHGVAESVRVLELPATLPNEKPLPPKGDVSDFLNAGGDAATLRKLSKDAPLWKPPTKAAQEKAAKQEARDTARLAREKALQERGKRNKGMDGLTEVETNDRHLRWVAADTLSALLAVNAPPTLFVRAGKLTRIGHNDGQASLSPLDLDMLMLHVADAANFVSTSEDRGVVAVNPPDKVVRYLMAMPCWPGLPPLKGLVTAPIMGADGTVYDTPGYQPETRLFYHETEKLVLGDTTPTPQNVRAALDLLLNELLHDFPFADDASRANALALLILPFARQMVDGKTPLHLIDAPSAGTGKSLLAEIITEIFQPGGAGKMQAPTNRDGSSDDEEWRKRITSNLLKGSPFFFVDNITGVLSSASLDLLLTTREWEDRILGQTKEIKLPVECVFIGTANNATVQGDTPRRIVWIRLDSGTESPDERDGFKIADIHGFVRRERPRLIGAVLTLLRAWVAAGRPPWSGKPVGSFENYSLVMGGILETVGVQGFLANRDQMKTRLNPERELWRGFFAECYGAHGEASVGVADVAETAKNHGIIDDLERGRKSLGRLLRARVDTVRGGLRLVADETKKHGCVQYRFVPEPGHASLNDTPLPMPSGPKQAGRSPYQTAETSAPYGDVRPKRLCCAFGPRLTNRWYPVNPSALWRAESHGLRTEWRPTSG